MKIIHHLKSKPEHIRDRIAYGTAAGITAIIALVWITTSVTTGGILSPVQFYSPQIAQNTASVIKDTTSRISPTSFLGSAATAFTSSKETQPVHLEIVNVSQSSTVPQTPVQGTGRTIIPF